MRFVHGCQTMKTDLRGIFRTALNKCCREAERIPNVLLCRTSVNCKGFFFFKKHCLFFIFLILSLFFLFPLTAKAVRPGHFPVCPSSPLSVQGYSEQPATFSNTVLHISTKRAADPAARVSEPRLPEDNSNRNSPGKHIDSQNNDMHDSDAQNNM